MAKLTINNQAFFTAALCSDNCCCVAISNSNGNTYIADTKDVSIPPILLNNIRWGFILEKIKTGALDLTVLCKIPFNSAKHRFSVRKEKSTVIFTDTSASPLQSLKFTLKEWDYFIDGAKLGNFDEKTLTAA